MALFNKRKHLKYESGKASNEVISSILSQSMHISGDIIFKGKARIEGLIEGKVQGEYLVLSETGKIIGNVEVDSLICHGTIEGDINCKQLTAHPTATLQGGLVAENLEVESGASLNGEVKARHHSETATKTTRPVAVKAIKEAA
jgi:cytoskeletal protein CcmA (bactofilin family)